MSFVLLLPIDIITDLLGNWLSLKEISKLDRCISHLQLRQKFFQLISSPGVIFNGREVGDTVHESYFAWIYNRNISVLRIKPGIRNGTIGYFMQEKVCRHVTSLDFSNGVSMSTKKLVSAISVCPKLEEFIFCEIGFPNIFDSYAVVALTTNCPSLKLFHISNSNKVEADLISTLTKGCPNIQDLRFYSCHGLDDAALEHLSTHCPKLQRLSLRVCESVTDAGLAHLARSCTRLTTLSIFACRQATSIDTIIRSSPGMSTIELSLCVLSPERLSLLQSALTRECPNLSTLGLAITNVSTPWLMEVITGCPKLRHLDVTGCASLRDDLPVITARCHERGIQCVTGVNKD